MPEKNLPIKKWLDRYLDSYPPRAKSLVMTLFGDAITPHGGNAWLGSLIKFLAPFHMSDRLVRTSVFRLAEEGWLEARREGRRSQYALNAVATQRFERAYQRIYTPVHRKWDGKWTLAFATSSTISTEQRARLRKELLWQGYGVLTPSVYLRPSSDLSIVDEIVTQIGLSGQVFTCQALESNVPTTRPLREIIDQCWELRPVVDDYVQFIESFSPLPKLLHNQKSLDPKLAFTIRTLLIHGFRRVQLHDPLLPLDLLPEGWPGKTAYELCRHIYQSTFHPAEQYVSATLAEENAITSEPAPSLYHRFGGLQ